MSKSQNHLFNLPAPDLAHILREAEHDLAGLRGKSIFLTGGTGFFGKWLLGGLVHANEEMGLGLDITILSRDPAAFARQFPLVGEISALRFRQGHVADFSPGEARFDYILHAATETTAYTREEDERERARTIIGGTVRMIELAKKCGAQRLLNISSGAVYGTFTSQPAGAKEDDYAGAVPLTTYAAAKRDAEDLCAASEIDFVTARAFAFLGPWLPLDAHFAAGNFLRDALKGGPILVRGDGSALRSYLHPADLVVWLLRMLIRGQRARAYNVGSDEAVTIAQLARSVAAAFQSPPEVVIQAVQSPGPQNIYLPDINRTQSELSLGVAIPLADAIPRTLAYLTPA